MKVHELFKKKVSYQKSAWAPITKEIEIEEVFSQIQGGKLNLQIRKLREIKENTDLYTLYKKNLPGVTFCGTFNGRRQKTSLKEYNSIIVLDVDKLNSENFKKTKEALTLDPFCFAYWESPSQEGIKGLVHITYESVITNDNIDTFHKKAFLSLRNYYVEKHNITIDASGSDITRLCFMSYDPSIVIKNEIESYKVARENSIEISPDRYINARQSSHKISKRDALYNPENKNKASERKLIKAIINYLNKRKLSITNSYIEWYRVAYAIANSFTYDVGERYFLELSRLDQQKYNEIECKNLLLSCYENTKGEINFRTILFYSREKGFKTKGEFLSGGQQIS